MFSDLLFKIALSAAIPLGWNQPSEDEMKSVNAPKDFVRLLVQYNPDRKDEIEQKFGDFQKLL